MTANHTGMFEVLYQVRILISLTHKLCEGQATHGQTQKYTCSHPHEGHIM